MKQIISDELFQVLYQVRYHPELLLGKRSLVALENYTRGYVDACRAHDRECFTVRWFDAFCDYIARTCGIKDKCFNLTYAIEGMGYNDTNGVEFFMELLDKFSERFDNHTKTPGDLLEIECDEIRVFRLDKTCAMDFCAKYIHEHCKELFGISSDAKLFTWVFNWDLDQSLTCALCGNSRSIAMIPLDSTEIGKKIKELPIFSLGEKIESTIIST